MAEAQGDREREKHLRDYITLTRQHFAMYHDHKEKMAYAAIALYLTGVSVLVFQGEPGWIKNVSCPLMNLMIIAFAGLTSSFIIWQFRKRYQAAMIVSGCDKVRIQWLRDSPIGSDVSPTSYNKIEMPMFLYIAIDNVKTPLTILWSSLVTLIVVIAWAAMLYWRLVSLVCH